MFVSKKKYNELLEQKKDLEKIATNAVAQNDRLLEEWNAAIQEKRDLRESNLRLVEYNDKLLAHCKELEAKLQGARQDSQQWAEDFEELDSAYGQLEIGYDRLCEERDHYEERCRYLEGEVEDKEELEAKLALVTEHIQLADGVIFAIEEALYRQRGDDVIQRHVDEYYEEVKLLDTK
jgi:chromosome segregation ATPase